MLNIVEPVIKYVAFDTFVMLVLIFAIQMIMSIVMLMGMGTRWVPATHGGYGYGIILYPWRVVGMGMGQFFPSGYGYGGFWYPWVFYWVICYAHRVRWAWVCSLLPHTRYPVGNPLIYDTWVPGPDLYISYKMNAMFCPQFCRINAMFCVIWRHDVAI